MFATVYFKISEQYGGDNGQTCGTTTKFAKIFLL